MHVWNSLRSWTGAQLNSWPNGMLHPDHGERPQALLKLSNFVDELEQQKDKITFLPEVV